MDTLDTRYGTLQGVSSAVLYDEGCVKKCTVSTFQEIRTPAGVFVPRYTDDGTRRKYIHSLSFYKSGHVESMELQEQQDVQTSLGAIPAEHIVLYESGKIKRVFPLNGRITGYWEEEDEYKLAPVLELRVSFGTFKQKVIAISFYEDGTLQSITFWPQDFLHVPTSLGTIETRTGISFYPQGEIKSLEPRHPTPVDTPIGIITAWNSNVLGLHGERNSLCFYQGGSIQSLLTSTDRITIRDTQGGQWVVQPGTRDSLCDEHAVEIVPLPIEFSHHMVRFNASAEHEYDIVQHTFTIAHGPLHMRAAAAACACMFE